MAWHNYAFEVKVDDDTLIRTGRSLLELKEYEALVKHQIANGEFGIPKDKRAALVSVREVQEEKPAAAKATPVAPPLDK